MLRQKEVPPPRQLQARYCGMREGSVLQRNGKANAQRCEAVSMRMRPMMLADWLIVDVVKGADGRRRTYSDSATALQPAIAYRIQLWSNCKYLLVSQSSISNHPA